MRKRKCGYRWRARLDPQIWSYFVDFFCRIGRKVETIRFTSLLGSSHFNEHLGRRSFVQRETTIRIQISGTWFIIIETQLSLTGFSFSKRTFWNSASSVNLPRRVQHCFLSYVLYLLFIFSYSKGKEDQHTSPFMRKQGFENNSPRYLNQPKGFDANSPKLL